VPTTQNQQRASTVNTTAVRIRSSQHNQTHTTMSSKDSVHCAAKRSNSNTRVISKKLKTMSVTGIPAVYLCGICALDVIDNPATFDQQSVQCDKCHLWFHYCCVDVDESCLPDECSRWFCSKCKL